jgi:hypothetical protein
MLAHAARCRAFGQAISFRMLHLVLSCLHMLQHTLNVPHQLHSLYDRPAGMLRTDVPSWT